MKICGFAQCYNEIKRGFLFSWLDHIKSITDCLAIYDDASNDDSSEYIQKNERNFDIVVSGGINNHNEETIHKQILLETVQKQIDDIDFFLWLDCDEIFEKRFISEAKNYCQFLIDNDYDSSSFCEITLWRSTCWARKDYLGNGRFVRLWRNNKRLSFKTGNKLHMQQFPQELNKTHKSNYNVIHYGYSNKNLIINRWHERNKLGVLQDERKKQFDEKNMILEHVDHTIFPETFSNFVCQKPLAIEYKLD